jgi:2'-5' RNA ligase
MTISIIRAFIAIDLSTEIQQRLNDVLDNYKTLLSKIPIRWVPVTNIHLTLKFLGELSTSNLNILTDMLKTEVTSHHQFEISVGGSGAFPNIRQPRIIWVGVEAPPELASIQIGIESATARLGYAREERAFSPHLTIGRISRNVSMLEVKVISQTLENNRVGFLGAICIEKVHLYRSDLQPTGAVYTRIFTASLNS